MGLESAPKVILDIICADIADRTLAKRLFEMQAGSLIGLVGLLCANRRFGVVLQEKIHPVRELELLSFPDDVEDLIVPGLKPLAQFALRLLPVFRER